MVNYTLFQVLKTRGHWADKVKVEQEPDALHSLLMSSAYSQTANSYLTLILSVQGGFRPRAIMISYHVFQFGNLLNIGLMVTMATIR